MSSDVSFFMWYTAGAVMFGAGYGYGDGYGNGYGDDCRDGDFESDTPPHF
jgi:hypothetical protein